MRKFTTTLLLLLLLLLPPLASRWHFRQQLLQAPTSLLL
jgi:hypothetical protein